MLGIRYHMRQMGEAADVPVSSLLFSGMLVSHSSFHKYFYIPYKMFVKVENTNN
jgi:hypothetical protein